MALFVVLALGKSGPAIEAAIMKAFPEDHYRLDAGKWFVRAPAVTSKNLSDQLGITSDADNEDDTTDLTGVVVKMVGYFGRGPVDLWEWIAAKSKVNA